MKKLILTIFVLCQVTGFGQRFIVQTMVDKNTISFTGVSAGCSYKMVDLFSTRTMVYACGLLWGTSPDLTFYQSYYIRPEGQGYAFSGLGTNNFACTIGDGKTGKTPLQANTTYYVRAFVFARPVLQERDRHGTRILGDKQVFYGETIKINTVPTITNNTVSSGSLVFCSSGNTFDGFLLTGSVPQNNGVSFTYQWEKKSATDVNWQGISGANQQNLNVSQQTFASATSVDYRRVISVSGEARPYASDPISIQFIPYNTDKFVTITRDYSTASLTMNASVFPLTANLTFQWQDSIAKTSLSFANISNENKPSLTLATIDTNKFYRCLVFYENSKFCKQYFSKIIGISRPDGNSNNYLYTTIGTQKWMIENLRATGTNVNPSVSFTYVKSKSDWISNANVPAYAYSNYTQSNPEAIGLFYSYPVTSQNVCPAGWRVPVMKDFLDLVSGTGGSNAGMNLKLNDKSSWTMSDNLGYNLYNFNTLSTGYIGGGGTNNTVIDPSFFDIGTISLMWGTNEYRLGIRNDSKATTVVKTGDIKHGFTIRCVK